MQGITEILSPSFSPKTRGLSLGFVADGRTKDCNCLKGEASLNMEMRLEAG